MCCGEGFEWLKVDDEILFLKKVPFVRRYKVTQGVYKKYSINKVIILGGSENGYR